MKNKSPKFNKSITHKNSLKNSNDKQSNYQVNNDNDIILDIKKFNDNFDEDKLDNLFKENVKCVFSKDDQNMNINERRENLTITKNNFYNTSDKFFSKSINKEKIIGKSQNILKYQNKLLNCINDPKNPYSSSWGKKILLSRYKVKFAVDGYSNGLPNLKLVKAAVKKTNYNKIPNNINSPFNYNIINKDDSSNYDKKTINKELFLKESLDITSNKPSTPGIRKPIIKKNTNSSTNKAENESSNNNYYNNTKEIQFPFIISCMKNKNK